MTVHEAFLEQDLLDLQNKIEEKDRRIAELEDGLKGKENEFKYFSNSFKKKIADLKKENAELNDKLNNLASVAEVRLGMWHKYKKENAELKEKLTGAERTRERLVQLGFPTFQSCKEYVALIKKMKCCGNCGKWENCEKDEMFSQDICGDWELER